jgi:hypothetical protein
MLHRTGWNYVGEFANRITFDIIVHAGVLAKDLGPIRGFIA